MKTAIWLYLFMFVALFDLHAQYPILSPFAVSLGATPSFIGLILGTYSITHLPGNVLAGFGVDRYGSKRFIVMSMILAGMVLVVQSRVTDPWQLLIIRSISGFVLAFLSPACLAMLAKLAKDSLQQSKFMAGNGLVHTLASVVSPAAGAYLVSVLGFSASFKLLGWGLIVTGLLAAIGLKENRVPALQAVIADTRATRSVRNPAHRQKTAQESIPWLFFGIPLSLSCAQGILFFELPLMKTSQESIMGTGLMFSMVSLGALLSLSMVFLNRIPAFWRTLIGSLGLAFVFFGMAIGWSVPLFASLFLIGMAKGVIFPAVSTLLAGVTPSHKYGRIFSILSIALSIGAFFGPVLAGRLRMDVSPYFLAFLAMMIGLSMLPVGRMRTKPVS